MRLSRRLMILAAVPAAAIAVVAALAVGGAASSTGSTEGAVASSDAAAQSTTSQWPPAAIERLTHLSALQGRPAPSFTLTDQHGKRISMASLRGKVVVLQPVDPECVDVCPIVSAELIDAAHALGSEAKDVVFLGLNVNEHHEQIASVNSFSREHRLNGLSNWHFLTGSTAALRRLWRAYSVTVETNKTGEVIHSSQMYFIDASGRWQWVALPQAEKLAIPQWGHAIAEISRHMLAMPAAKGGAS